MCHLQFGSVSTFDKHLPKDDYRPGTPKPCLIPSQVIRRDGRPTLFCDETKQGPVWRLATYGEED